MNKPWNSVKLYYHVKFHKKGLSQTLWIDRIPLITVMSFEGHSWLITSSWSSSELWNSILLSNSFNSALTLITGSADNSFLYLFKVYKNSKNLCIWYGNNQLQNQLHKKARKCYTNKMIFHKLFQGKVLSLVILAAFKIIYCSSLQLPKYRKNIKN